MQLENMAVNKLEVIAQPLWHYLGTLLLTNGDTKYVMSQVLWDVKLLIPWTHSALGYKSDTSLATTTRTCTTHRDRPFAHGPLCDVLGTVSTLRGIIVGSVTFNMSTAGT